MLVPKIPKRPSKKKIKEICFIKNQFLQQLNILPQ